MSTAVTSPPKKTPGEELFLVHLRRQNSPHHEPNPEEDEDDHDYPEPRKRSRSVGEELFNIHLKRSEGMDPDYDCEKGDKKEEDEGEMEHPAKKQEVEGPAMTTPKDAQDHGLDEKPQEDTNVQQQDGSDPSKKPQ